MKKLMVLLLACLTATSVLAVIDPDPDSIGIYFDTAAEDNCLIVPAGIPFMAYLILTNPTAPAINAYEFGLENVVPAGMESLFYRLATTPGNRVWAGPPIPGNNHLGGDFVVGLPYSIVAEPATILHSWQYMFLEYMPVEMYLHQSSNPSIPGVYPIVQNAEGSILMQVYQSSGGPDIPVATVNTDCVVGVEGASFGSVKALFR
ncbi:MAG: hypothetical protein ABFS42_00500 [Candidatus Krumholzibacteriota bacterium]